MNRPDMVPAIDLKQIEEVQLAIGASKVGRLLGIACDELASRPRAMRALADAHDFALLRKEAHGFKGAVASVGLVGAARAAKAVELALPGAELHHSLDRLDREATRALVAVRSLLAQCGLESAPRS
jgi:HPt (histidine-containing phosphotransfer) domain-containing protein